MSRFMLLRSAAAVTLLCVLNAGAPPARSAPAKLTQRQALEAIAAKEKVTVVAELSSPSLQLQKGALDAEVDWNDVSREFDLHVIRRGSTVGCLRRNVSLARPLDLEREELALLFSDLDRLLRPSVPYGEGEYTARQVRFANSLTTAQVERMRAEGLPFKDLPAAQQAEWLLVNAASVYGRQDLVFRRTAERFAHWRNQELAWVENSTGEPVLFVGSGADDRLGLNQNSRRTWPQPQCPPSVESGEQRKGLPAAWSKSVQILAGEQSVSSLTKALESSTGLTIQRPAYAADRRLLILPHEPRAVDLAAALEDIYGWELRYVRGKTWTLDRPRFQPARDAIELHARMTRAIPPGLRLMMRSGFIDIPGASSSFSMLAASHQALIYGAMMKELNEQYGPNWKKLRVADIPEPAQRRLANLISLLDCKAQLQSLVSTPLPRARLTGTSEGVFRVGGERGQPLKGSVLSFETVGPDGKPDRWGWRAGSSSLEN